MPSGVSGRRARSPGAKSAETAEKALRAAGIDRRHVGALVHGSVCRDFARAGHRLRRPSAARPAGRCAVYDVSNACLGLLNGMLQVANMIELGQIRAGLVVGTESSRELVESTIELPQQRPLAVASGHQARLRLADHRFRQRRRAAGGPRSEPRGQPAAGRGRPRTDGPVRALPRRRGAPAGGGDGESQTLMWTDCGDPACTRASPPPGRPSPSCSPRWAGRPPEIDKTFCHQVGRAHRKLLLDALGLDADGDFTTFEMLGNTGSVALPITAAMGIEQGHVRPGDRVAMMGIGSGINVVMLGIEWERPPAASQSVS